jgi:zinc D-Ala-D-Ala dipeptidase
MDKTIPIEQVPGHADFRALAAIPGAIRVDLRYASPDNLLGTDVYSPFDCAWIHREGAGRLEAAARELARRRPDLTLLVLDALRPQRVQQRFWDTLPPQMRSYFADPRIGSIHSFGMAVDVTLCDAAGRELDMGTGFDDTTERSHPALEEGFLIRGELTQAQVDARRLLRETMAHAGWRGINTEWWHFDGGDRDRIRAEYLRVL